jgi:hypothetical protein
MMSPVTGTGSAARGSKEHSGSTPRVPPVSPSWRPTGRVNSVFSTRSGYNRPCC